MDIDPQSGRVAHPRVLRHSNLLHDPYAVRKALHPVAHSANVHRLPGTKPRSPSIDAVPLQLGRFAGEAYAYVEPWALKVGQLPVHALSADASEFADGRRDTRLAFIRVEASRQNV